jgi:transposase
MPNKRLSMRKIRDVLRLHFEAQLSRRAIGRCLNLSQVTVGNYLSRFEHAGLSWPLHLDEAELERRLFPVPTYTRERPMPDWAVVHHELRRKGVTLHLLWLEYKARHADGFQYTWFCDHYRAYSAKLDLVMRQSHRAGEKLFVDYAGQTVEVTEPRTGQLRQAQIFVAVLGASNYTYAEATWTQTLPDWIAAHQRAFHFFGGVPELVVPDNLKAAVRKAHRYEPDLNVTYAELAAHYGTVVIPARVRKPRDKAKVEAGVLLVERWILARLRHERFFALTALNQRIAALLEQLNRRPFKKLPGSRRALFEELDRPALKALPLERYQYAEWKRATVPPDYHLEADGHYYSVPYALVGQQVELRLSATTVECFHRGHRVASHARSPHPGLHTTVNAHRPKAHQHYAEWSVPRLRQWSQSRGGATGQVVRTILEQSPHPQQGLRSGLAVIRLEQSYGAERLEAACARALALGACSFKSIASILKHGLDAAAPDPAAEAVGIAHANIRGPAYYQ